MLLFQDRRGNGIEYAVVLSKAAQIESRPVGGETHRLSQRAVLTFSGGNGDGRVQAAQAVGKDLADAAEADDQTTALIQRRGSLLHGQPDCAFGSRHGVSCRQRGRFGIIQHAHRIFRQQLARGIQHTAEHKRLRPQAFQHRAQRNRLSGTNPAVRCQCGHRQDDRDGTGERFVQTVVRVRKLRHAVGGDIKAAARQLLHQPCLTQVAAEHGNFLKHSIPSFRHILCETGEKCAPVPEGTGA